MDETVGEPREAVRIERQPQRFEDFRHANIAPARRVKRQIQVALDAAAEIDPAQIIVMKIGERR